jgi:2-(1,2-epoxy-1,2-dihydrophenyl)acetyl-CoA isomerase
VTARRMSDSLIISSVAKGVGTITLNRPGVSNALNLAMARQFLHALTGFDRDDSVRAIVLRGSGKVFSAGGDVREMLGDVQGGGDRAAYFRAPLSAFGEMILAVRDSPKPVLAAVYGAVAGVAFNLMLACDLKIAVETTRFTLAFIRVGLSPDGGGGVGSCPVSSATRGHASWPSYPRSWMREPLGNGV